MPEIPLFTMLCLRPRPAAGNQISWLLPGGKSQSTQKRLPGNYRRDGAHAWPVTWPGVVALNWRPRAMAGYAAGMLLLAVAYYGFPGQRGQFWALIGLTGVAAIVAGTAMNRPARRAPWLLLAAASACLLASQAGFPDAGRAGLSW